MMRRTARLHESETLRQIAGVDAEASFIAQQGDRVVTVDGPGVVANVYPGPYPGAEGYEVVLDNGLGGGEYDPGQILNVIGPVEIVARRYSQTPMACDVCGAPASKSSSGGRGGHTMLCPDCIAERDRQKVSVQGGDQREGASRTAARSPLPLLEPEDLRAQGLHVASEDYPQLSEILWERPDLVEAEPVAAMPRRMRLASATYPTDTGEHIDRVKAAEVMYGTGSPQHLKAIERFSPKTAKPAEPTWLKERPNTNPIKRTLEDKKQPWWWRKMVGPAMDRYNDALPEDRQTRTEDDLHKIKAIQWCRFRRDGDCYFPKDYDTEGSEAAGYAVWTPYNRGECPWKTKQAQKHECKVSEPGPKSGEQEYFPDATISWSQGGQRMGSLQEVPVTITSKWVDVRDKGKRIRQSGGVRIISANGDTITGEIRGDTGLYTTTITLVPGTSQVALATCSCPWETYRWARSGPWKSLEGRACAHIAALLYEMQSRKMFGGEITEDVAEPEWRTEQPALENPKSTPGEWRLDRASALQAHLLAVASVGHAVEARAAVDPSLDSQAAVLAIAVEAMADCLDAGEYDAPEVPAQSILTEARSLAEVPSFYAQVNGEIVIVDGFDDDGIPWANGRELSVRDLMYPTYHPTLGLHASLKSEAMFEPRPDGEELARDGEIIYRRKSMLGDRGVEAWLGDRSLVGVLIWGTDGEIASVDVDKKYRNRGTATKMFELAKQVEPKVHHSNALTEDGKAWSKAVGASLTLDVPDDVREECASGKYSFAGLVIKAADSGRVLLTQRTPYHGDDEDTYGKWEFPGGGLDDGEDPLLGALREFREETGMDLPEGYRIEGCDGNGRYLSILVTVPNEAWTTHATLLPLETMGIGWFEVDHVEEEAGDLTRPEVEDADFEMIREAVVEAVVGNQVAESSREVAILHDEPEPALPEAYGAAEDPVDPVSEYDDPSLFIPTHFAPSTVSPRSEPNEPFTDPTEVQWQDPLAMQGAFVPGDPRLAWLMEGTPQQDDADIAGAAQAVLAKIALKTFSIEEQHDLINEGADDHRGSRNDDRLAIEGTHYEAAMTDDPFDLETLW